MQDKDQYINFTIKLLKGSFALNALWQDALNYHMIDQPDKLIAMRLTEYYELVARGALRPGPTMVGVAPLPTPGLGVNPATPPPASGFGGNTSTPPQTTVSGKLPELATRPPQAPVNPPGQANEAVSSAPTSIVEQNAEDAADYWAPL